jgi:hypothetical protein
MGDAAHLMQLLFNQIIAHATNFMALALLKEELAFHAQRGARIIKWQKFWELIWGQRTRVWR